MGSLFCVKIGTKFVIYGVRIILTIRKSTTGQTRGLLANLQKS